MNKTTDMDGTAYDFTYEDLAWSITFPKSKTHAKELAQLELLEKPATHFVPATISSDSDSYMISYEIDKHTYGFEQIRKMEREDKLRALRNIADLSELLNTRYTFFLHPDNLIFDINLVPRIVHRGIKNILPPYELTEETFLKQYQCFAIAMFSKKFTFENLYNGSLSSARGTQFEKNILDAKTVQEVATVLEEAYIKENKSMQKNMARVPKKKYGAFRGLAVGFIIVAILLAIPVSYFAFVKVPLQDDLLTANEQFLKTDYDKVITGLEKVDPEKMPQSVQYELAYSYVNGEKMSDKKKENIMNTISLKSDPKNLLYWIYNGRGEFSESLDIAKLLDDPTLAMYSLTKQIEQVQSDTKLSGEEKVEKLKTLEDSLKAYDDKINEQTKETDESTNTEAK
ncbi:type VII secretion protein EssB [Listeria welshimeri]|uniref:type VII secretion protein EssB n=1 Tax=Listeria welshimeri TaxID=1643 RepID=UPI00162439A5|nr:type VII secretion protein EssB [Listeria welshimeri]MBC1252752.1 type VII secretion protein EssB [Listeria welshimeri]MBC1495266.1 type VII secretion protein EssB [Listeria welshimeri]MBC1608100.1 type VII secretion protein EssB [Listeria welshimeri]MBC1613072.1 type VII secretion protein EssB [Listeria welshimeri]MBC1622665.1 type VII secretion protein EssB [Listeria welshimeri]